MARYIVQVPIKWHGSVNIFKVEVDAADEATANVLDEIRRAAVQDVEGRGIEIVPDRELEVFRKK